jgi:hypothetical protein
VTDAKSEAVRFYEKMSFMPLDSEDNKVQGGVFYSIIFY